MATDFADLSKSLVGIARSEPPTPERASLRRLGLMFQLTLTRDGAVLRQAAGRLRLELGKVPWIAFQDPLRRIVLQGLFKGGLDPLGDRVRFAPLFPVDSKHRAFGSHLALERYLLFRVRGVAFDDLLDIEVDPWDLAYELWDGIEAASETGLLASLLADTPSNGVKCYESPTADPASEPDWSLSRMQVPAAWTMATGGGVLVGHPDTGYSGHPQLDPGRLRVGLGYDFLDDVADPVDPLRTNMFNTSPGHGTSTATLVMSAAGTPPGSFQERVDGVAPACDLVPIRCCEATAIIGQVPIAQAMFHAVDQGCHVISLSLGGLPTQSDWTALRYAVERNVIVVAAAGQCVPWPIKRQVIWPARYRDCIAVAASTVDDKGWDASSRGSRVTVSAPGAAVRVTEIEKPAQGPIVHAVGLASGTSFSAAYVAGIAALWLSYQSYIWLLGQVGQGRPYPDLQKLFAHVLRTTADNLSGGWDTARWGAGIAQAAPALQLPMPVAADEAADEVGDDGEPSFLELLVELIAELFELDGEEAALDFLSETFGVHLGGEDLERWSPETMHRIFGHGELLVRHVGFPAPGRAPPSPERFRRFLLECGSQALRQRLAAPPGE